MTEDVADSSESALQVYKHRRSKHRHKEKKIHKEKKRRSEESAAVTSRESRHLAKRKKKSKDRKRRRSWSRSDSSDDDDERRQSNHRSRQRHRSRSNSQSRSQSCSHKEETRIVKQPAKDVVQSQNAGEQEDKLFEFDRVGDRDNQFFGSTYAHDQPLYELATRRNLRTGAWVSQARPKYTSSDMPGKEKYNQNGDRYFSLQARKLEKNARQKRLYLAYSEKRLSRATAEDKLDQPSQAANLVVTHRPPEMAYIPLDPILDVVSDSMDEVSNSSNGMNGILLTDGQSVEQHLVERSKLLNSAVAANPHIIDSWLDLMAFQEQTMRLQANTKRLSSAMKASIAEKQAAILARALANNPQSRELHCVKLNMSLQTQTSGEGGDMESFQRQLESLLSEDVTNSELWIKLLQSRHQHFGSFSMQAVRDLYARIITVLRKECANAAETATELAPPVPDASEIAKISTQAGELSVSLLDFHFLMCQFEKRAGFIERSIAQLQALIDFTFNGSAVVDRSSNKEDHLELLRKFALRWNKEGTLAVGDEWSGKTELSSGVLLEENSPKPSPGQLQDYIQKNCVTTVDQVNPPEVLRTEKHRQSLLSASAAYQRRSRKNDGKGAAGSKNDNNEVDSDSSTSDDSEAESRRGGKLIYSNLHGYRINIDDANDTKEYERILAELRGTENARARQAQLLEKEKMKRAVLAETKSQVGDQRASYDSVDGNDRYLQWLNREEVQTQMQWAPLRSNNPLHQNLIEEQPDRATLTEEIQPFLFPVPKAYQWRLIVEILQICGVEWRGEYSWETSLPACESMYSDSPADYELLVAPILSVVDPQVGNSDKHKLFLDPCDRKKLLERALLGDIAVNRDVLCDPSRVEFVRRVFSQALDIFRDTDEDFESALKCLWIGFEAELSRSIGAPEESIAYCRHLSRILAKRGTDGDTDFNVLHAYAKLEFTLGNERQVRRICENALKSLGELSINNMRSARAFHRFVFLRARLEMWPSSGERKKPGDYGQLRLLRCLYALWSARQPGKLGDKGKETLVTIAKKYKNRIRDYLHEQLMSDPSTKTDLIAKYRADLHLAVRQCDESAVQSSKASLRSSCWVGYCLHNLALIVYAYDGFDAACREYRQAFSNADHGACSHVAWMWTCFLEFMQQHQVSGLSPVLAPRVWRSSVGEAVEKYPTNEIFLRLFVDAETGNTISQVLRNYFLRVEKRWQRHFDSPELVEWLFALLCEFYRVERAATIKELSKSAESGIDRSSRPTCCLFHRWGMNLTAVNRIRQMFENMVNQIRTKGSALCWGLYMRFEVALGKVDAAKKVLYRGIAACAWSKALYMDGLRVLRAYLSEDECQELLAFMEAKELNLRVDFD
ncbi:NRDE2 protein [Phytophthora nicotianae]|uniref:NRDE2 protein n=2 Tax=Phytophthora nicotianae TaxID=4792 RepID=A0A0W8CNB3_PHYNI|nr:NRDE2 protein [Phytophthora nicotianae]